MPNSIFQPLIVHFDFIGAQEMVVNESPWANWVKGKFLSVHSKACLGFHLVQRGSCYSAPGGALGITRLLFLNGYFIFTPSGLCKGKEISMVLPLFPSPNWFCRLVLFLLAVAFVCIIDFEIQLTIITIAFQILISP